MKRLTTRIAGLSSVLVLGAVGIGQTLRSNTPEEETTPKTAATSAGEQGTPQPIPITTPPGGPRAYSVPSPHETVLCGNDEPSRFESPAAQISVRQPAESYDTGNRYGAPATQLPATRSPATSESTGHAADPYGLVEATRTALNEHQPAAGIPATVNPATGIPATDQPATGTPARGIPGATIANARDSSTVLTTATQSNRFRDSSPSAQTANNAAYLSDSDPSATRGAENQVAQAPVYAPANRYGPPANNQFSNPPISSPPVGGQQTGYQPRYGENAVTQPQTPVGGSSFQSRTGGQPSGGFRSVNSQPNGVSTPPANPARTIVDPRAPGRGISSTGAEIYRIEGKGVPGSRQIEGLQTPAITIEKRAPEEIQVNKPATFEVHVRNVGKTVAHEVTVHDEIPQGTRLVDASPQFSTSAGGQLMWNIGTLQPGEESVIALQLIPLTEGELGSVAHVTFQAQASARTVCTRPQLTVDMTAPPKVLIDETVRLSITLSNPGSGAATGVIIEEDVPEGLTHPAGTELEYEVGTIRAGESKRLELELTADKAGIVNNVLIVRADGNLESKKVARIEVLAPDLQVELVGPRLRYLERQATYTISVSNPGTAKAKDVELVAWLPKGLKFVTTENKGQYDPKRHAVFWSLEELPPATTGAVQLTALPIEIGQQKLRVESRADRGLTNEHELEIMVDGLAELMFTVSDKADPIEIGAENLYEIRVTNNGSKSDSNVRLVAELPDGLRPVSGDGPTRGAVRGNRVIFDPLPQLQPKDEVVYRVAARGERRGVQVVRVIIASDQAETPVTKEESTRVYADE